MNQLIGIIHNNWNKTKFTVWIGQPKPSDQISSLEYANLVKNAIDTWQKVLRDYANANAGNEHLNEIEFSISENRSGDEDTTVLLQLQNSSRSLILLLFFANVSSVVVV